MRTFDRVLLIFWGIVNMVFGGYLGYLHFEVEHNFYIYRVFESRLTADLVIIAVFILLLFVGTSLIAIALSSVDYTLTNRDDTVVLSSDENGKAEITYAAIRSIVKRKCLSLRSIVDCSTDVAETDSGLELHVSIKPAVNAELPALIEQLKKEVSDTVATQTGLIVKSIDVLVLTGANPQKSKI